MRAVVAYGLVGMTVSLACSRASLTTDTAPTTSRQSFVVTATIMPSDGGSPVVPLPSTHRFTLVIDWGARMAIMGANGGGNVVPFQATGTGGTISLPVVLGAGGYINVGYENIDFMIDSTGSLAGTAQGRASYSPPTTDIVETALVTASLTGVPDNEPPALTAKGVSATATDPFNSLMVTASEPLPPGTRLVLSDLRGDQIDLVPPTDAKAAAFWFAPATARMWRYDDQYTVSLAGVADFAGNMTVPGSTFTFMIAAAPPLVAQDGFESATGTTLAGAQVLSGAGAPTISGSRSLYIPPVTSNPLGQGDMKQLALRLALAPGDTVVRFAYRTVKPSNAPSAYFAPGYHRLASEGGQIGYFWPMLTDMPATTVSIAPSGDFLVGPITTAEIPLPPDAAGEITLIRIAPGGSGLPPPPVMGLIIDDLRTE